MARPTALTLAETTALWAVDFDADTIRDAHLCTWQRGAHCEQLATDVVHCIRCGGTRLELCPKHVAIVAAELDRVAERRSRALCGTCLAHGPAFDIYVIHPIGAC